MGFLRTRSLRGDRGVDSRKGALSGAKLSRSSTQAESLGRGPAGASTEHLAGTPRPYRGHWLGPARHGRASGLARASRQSDSGLLVRAQRRSRRDGCEAGCFEQIRWADSRRQREPRGRRWRSGIDDHRGHRRREGLARLGRRGSRCGCGAHSRQSSPPAAPAGGNSCAAPCRTGAQRAGNNFFAGGGRRPGG